MQGPEEHYALGEEIARVIWAPILRSHKVTVDQMALLEPGLSETVCASLLDVMREAMDEVVARGVPQEAARDFLLQIGRAHVRTPVTDAHVACCLLVAHTTHPPTAAIAQQWNPPRRNNKHTHYPMTPLITTA